MTLPSRAAAVRGDDYQIAIGWYWACQALADCDIESIAVEDPAGGYFDDVVVRRRTTASTYMQIKSSNHAKITITEDWLTTSATPTGRSPLQHLYDTWLKLRAEDALAPEIALVTNRGLDPHDPILALRDNHSETVSAQLRAKGPRSDAGKARQRWAEHLGVIQDELYEFLDALRLRTEGSESSWDRQARDAMRAAGLRADNDALARGKSIAREWLKTGAGPQRTHEIRRQVAESGLLARAGTLVLAVHAIDRLPSSVPPTVEVDWVDRYDGSTPGSRRQLSNPADWQTVIAPELAANIRILETYGVRRVHITGAMRVPVWFAVGAALPDVRGWVLSCDQRNVEWRTDTVPVEMPCSELARADIGQGPDLAVAIAITHDLTKDVVAFLTAINVPVSGVRTLGPVEGPGHNSLPDAAHAIGWARAARRTIRELTTTLRPRRLHLFCASPGGAALVLGHQWNLLPPTDVYEHLGHTYAPTLEVS